MTDLTATYDGTLERTPDGGVIRFERHLAFAIDDVWDAITNPDRLGDWWLPFEADITIDLREGGAIVMDAIGEVEMRMEMTVLRVEPPVLLEHTHADPAERLLWELETVEGGTVLRLSHFVTDPTTAVERCYVVGLHTSLGRLVPSLEGHPIPWDDDEFAISQARYAEVGLAPTPEA